MKRPRPAITDGADVVVFSIDALWYWRLWWEYGSEACAGPFDSADEAMEAARADGKKPYLDCPF